MHAGTDRCPVRRALVSAGGRRGTEARHKTCTGDQGRRRQDRRNAGRGCETKQDGPLPASTGPRDDRAPVRTKLTAREGMPWRAEQTREQDEARELRVGVLCMPRAQRWPPRRWTRARRLPGEVLACIQRRPAVGPGRAGGQTSLRSGTACPDRNAAEQQGHGRSRSSAGPAEIRPATPGRQRAATRPRGGRGPRTRRRADWTEIGSSRQTAQGAHPADRRLQLRGVPGGRSWRGRTPQF